SMSAPFPAGGGFGDGGFAGCPVGGFLRPCAAAGAAARESDRAAIRPVARQNLRIVQLLRSGRTPTGWVGVGRAAARNARCRGAGTNASNFKEKEAADQRPQWLPKISTMLQRYSVWSRDGTERLSFLSRRFPCRCGETAWA